MSTHTVVRYSDEDLEEFRVLIEDKLEKAKNELEFMREQIVELNENSSDQQGGDWFDDSSVHMELEMLNNMVIRQQQFISNLENALVRVRNKTYGICVITGELIEKKRLLLVPHATKSVSAKEIQPKAEVEPVIPEIEIKKPAVIEPRIITKVIKKPSASKAANKPKIEEEDDDFEWDLDEEELEVNEEYGGVNLDEIADEDSF